MSLEAIETLPPLEEETVPPIEPPPQPPDLKPRQPPPYQYNNNSLYLRIFLCFVGILGVFGFFGGVVLYLRGSGAMGVVFGASGLLLTTMALISLKLTTPLLCCHRSESEVYSAIATTLPRGEPPPLTSREPPPTYAASMQEYRLRLLLYERSNPPHLFLPQFCAPPPPYPPAPHPTRRLHPLYYHPYYHHHQPPPLSRPPSYNTTITHSNELKDDEQVVVTVNNEYRNVICTGCYANNACYCE